MGYKLSDDMSSENVVQALKMAVQNRKSTLPLIHHSDRGLQYCSAVYTGLLKENGIDISMTIDGDPYENAVAERVNGILKYELGLKEVARLNAEMEKVKETIQVVAWFTPDIPVPHGPENFFGLPGLILEVQSSGRTLICEKIELNPSAEPVAIIRPKRGKEVTREEFRAIQEESMKQMMNRYQGKPGDGNQFTIRIGN